MFPTMVKLQSIQILMHQYKIPRMIEVSCYTPPGVHAVHNEHLVSSGKANDFFKKIGHFTLEDNSATSFKARELKTVYIN